MDTKCIKRQIKPDNARVRNCGPSAAVFNPLEQGSPNPNYVLGIREKSVYCFIPNKGIFIIF